MGFVPLGKRRPGFLQTRDRPSDSDTEATFRFTSNLPRKMSHTERACYVHGHHRNKTTGAMDGSGSCAGRVRNGEQLVDLRSQTLSTRWCPHRVDHMIRLHTPETLSYLAAQISSSHRLVDHAQCANSSSCIAYNTDLGTYKTQHTATDCPCPTISVPYNRLIDLIQNEIVPLVSIEIDDGHDRMLRLRLHPRSRRSTYIAISHVWFDGLGNPAANALPLCQLRKLKERLLVLQNILMPLENIQVSNNHNYRPLGSILNQ